MKLFDIEGHPDTIAAGSMLDAIDFATQMMLDDGMTIDEIGDVRATEVKDMNRQVYDEEGIVTGTSSIVTYQQMYDVEVDDWDGEPYVFSSLEY